MRHTLEYQLAHKEWKRKTRDFFSDPVRMRRINRPILGWFWALYYSWKAPLFPVREYLDSLYADKFIKR